MNSSTCMSRFEAFGVLSSLSTTIEIGVSYGLINMYKITSSFVPLHSPHFIQGAKRGSSLLFFFSLAPCKQKRLAGHFIKTAEKLASIDLPGKAGGMEGC